MPQSAVFRPSGAMAGLHQRRQGITILVSFRCRGGRTLSGLVNRIQDAMRFRRVIPYALVLGLLGLIALILGGIKVMQVIAIVKAAETMAEPEETVSTFEAAEDRWEQVLPAIGTVAAVRGVMVSTDLPGVVRESRLNRASRSRRVTN